MDRTLYSVCSRSIPITGLFVWTSANATWNNRYKSERIILSCFAVSIQLLNLRMVEKSSMEDIAVILRG